MGITKGTNMNNATNTHSEWLTKAIEYRNANGTGVNGMKPLAGRFVVQHTSRTHTFKNWETNELVNFMPFEQWTWAVLDVTMRDENGCWLIVKDGFATAKAAKEYAKGLVK
jgi:hypothetical protein